MQNNKIIQKFQESATILRIIGTVLVLLSFAIFIYNTSNQEIDINVKDKEIILKDSIIDRILVQTNRKDSLKIIVKNYFELRKLHDVEMLDSFFSDTVISYFKYLRNCHKKEIKASDKKYWEKYKQDAFYIKSEPDVILNENDAKVIVEGLQCRKENECIDVVVEIRFDSKNKINFVRSYYANLPI